MNTKVTLLHYRSGSFSGEIYSQAAQDTLTFEGQVHYCNSLDGIEISQIEFSEKQTKEEHAHLESVVYTELDNHCGEIYQDTQDDQLDAHEQSREDERMGN